eukprot:scaffold490156_cov38-Prasinocladus_malaysianus.AAC.2
MYFGQVGACPAADLGLAVLCAGFTVQKQTKIAYGAEPTVNLRKSRRSQRSIHPPGQIGDFCVTSDVNPRHHQSYIAKSINPRQSSMSIRFSTPALK